MHKSRCITEAQTGAVSGLSSDGGHRAGLLLRAVRSDGRGGEGG